MECYTSRFSRQCTWQINRRRQHLTGNPSALSFKRRNHPKRKECRIGISKCSVGQDQSSVEGSERKPAAARLFSNVNTSTLKHEPGSLFGAASLVAGTAVGAGILALPYSTEEAGFVASSTAIVATCLYSIVTGLLLAEVNINTMCELGSGGVSLVSMAERTLGKVGTRFASGTYLFLHYTLLVAYISRAGEVIGSASGSPHWLASTLFAAGLGSGIYFTSSKALDEINSVLVGLVVATFAGLLGLAGAGLHPEALLKADWVALPATLPVIALAFVFQNVVPVITASLEGDIKKVRMAIVAGVGVPLIMFLAWDAVILGSLPPGGSAGKDPLLLLSQSSDLVGPLIQVFSLLAIATSFIGFVLGLSDFIADAMKMPSGKQAVPFVLTLAPPLVLALTFPNVFFAALDLAGTYGVLVLFGLLPVAMVWSERYGGSTISTTQIVGGGKPVLALIGGSAAAVILYEAVLQNMH